MNSDAEAPCTLRRAAPKPHPFPMRKDERIASMLDRARELAARGHYPMMIEAVLAADGFPEAAEWIDQPHIRGDPVVQAVFSPSDLASSPLSAASR